MNTQPMQTMLRQHSIIMALGALCLFGFSVSYWVSPMLESMFCLVGTRSTPVCLEELAGHPNWQNLSVLNLYWTMVTSYVSLRMLRDAIRMCSLSKLDTLPTELNQISPQQLIIRLVGFHAVQLSILASLPFVLSALASLIAHWAPTLDPEIVNRFLPGGISPWLIVQITVLLLIILWVLRQTRSILYFQG